MDKKEAAALKIKAAQIRIAALTAIHSLGSGHVGGSLSICDALAVLFGREMKTDPKNPKWPERDKLVTSKGHAGPAVYGALAVQGYFPYEELVTLNKPGTHLPSHTDRNLTPGVDMPTGSLGQGTSVACGMALGDRLKGRDCRTFLIVGDGESDEGQVWEAFAFAAAFAALSSRLAAAFALCFAGHAFRFAGRSLNHPMSPSQLNSLVPMMPCE